MSNDKISRLAANFIQIDSTNGMNKLTTILSNFSIKNFDILQFSQYII